MPPAVPGYNPGVQLRLTFFIAAICLSLANPISLPLAQSNLEEDLIPTTTPEIDPAAQATLDYLPQLPDSSATSSTLKGILAKPEYNGGEEPPGESWRDKVFNWLTRALGRLGGGRSTNYFGVVAIVLLIGLLLFLLVRLAWNMFGGRRFSTDPKQSASLENLSPEDLVAQAAKAATGGDFQLAIRLRFKAVLGALKMPSSAVLTNSQVLRKLKHNMPFAAKPFRELAGIFEETWYGAQPCSAVEYQLVSECAGKIEQGLGEHK